MEIILATTNPAKVVMLSRVVSRAVRVRPLPESLAHRSIPDSVEAARSIGEIAESKAVYWSLQLPGRFVAATDGGLLIPALGDRWDPARTARFAGLHVSNQERIEELLRLAAGLAGDQRQILWREALTVAVDGQVMAEWTAESPLGILADTAPSALPESQSGFWVPAIWLCPEHDNRPLSTLTDEEQARRSDHWSTLGAHLTEWCQTLSSGKPT